MCLVLRMSVSGTAPFERTAALKYVRPFCSVRSRRISLFFMSSRSLSSISSDVFEIWRRYFKKYVADL